MTYTKQAQLSAANRAIQCVRGTPNCGAFYDWALAQLEYVTSRWQPPTGSLTEGQRGNVGEFLSFIVAHDSGLSGPGFTAALGGALAPLQIGTSPGLDVTILHLAPDGNTARDCLYVMEVKTTGQLVLNYAYALVGDYAKLLDLTRPSTSLGSRMSQIKAKLKFEHGFPDALLDRVEDLYRPNAADCTRIRLLPTLVHDIGSGNPVITLDDVAQRIEALGWPAASIEPWSIALTRLNECIEHLVQRAPFVP